MLACLDEAMCGLGDADPGTLAMRSSVPHETDLLVEIDVGPDEVIRRFRQERGFPELVRSRARPKRLGRVRNVSDKGLGIELDERDAEAIASGDVLALRLAPGLPLELCVVVRTVLEPASRVVWIGARRLSSNARALEVSRIGAASEVYPLLFIPGKDGSGRDDACLIDPATFARGTAIPALVHGVPYAFHFTRPCESGRGWMLARFEIKAALHGPHSPSHPHARGAS